MIRFKAIRTYSLVTTFASVDCPPPASLALTPLALFLNDVTNIIITTMITVFN